MPYFLRPRRNRAGCDLKVGGYDKDRFKQAEAIEEEFLCSICMNVFRNPKLLPCRHMFCQSCLTNWITNAQALEIEHSDNDDQLFMLGFISCPACRSKFNCASNEVQMPSLNVC